MKNILNNAVLFAIFVCFTFGLYYNGSRFNVPWYGNNDFVEYHKMVESPFDNDAIAPFAYRALTPTIAHFIYKSGFYFKSKSSTPFEDKFLEYDGVKHNPEIFKALFFTNFILITLTCFIISILVKQSLLSLKNDRLSLLLQIFLPLLLLLSISTIRDSFAPINEAGNLLIVTLLFYAYRVRNVSLFILIAMFSVIQRDIASLILLVYITSAFQFKKDLYFITTCICAIITYWYIKTKLFPIAGWDFHNDIFFLISNAYNFSNGLIYHAFFGNNIFYAVVLILIFILKVDFKNCKVFIPYLITLFFIVILSNMFQIGNSVDRLMNTITPIFIILIADLIKLEYENHKNV